MPSTDNTLARTLHDLGLAAWFGGSLMGAAGLNGAASVVDDPSQRLRVANTGWARWTPLNLAGIAAHLAGGAVLTGANKGRLAGQQGVAGASRVKTALTGDGAVGRPQGDGQPGDRTHQVQTVVGAVEGQEVDVVVAGREQPVQERQPTVPRSLGWPRP